MTTDAILAALQSSLEWIHRRFRIQQMQLTELTLAQRELTDTVLTLRLRVDDLEKQVRTLSPPGFPFVPPDEH